MRRPAARPKRVSTIRAHAGQVEKERSGGG